MLSGRGATAGDWWGTLEGGVMEEEERAVVGWVVGCREGRGEKEEEEGGRGCKGRWMVVPGRGNLCVRACLYVCVSCGGRVIDVFPLEAGVGKREVAIKHQRVTPMDS